MSTTEAQITGPGPTVARVDMNLEIQVIAVADVDRTKQFYERLGWRLDDDVAPMDGLRIVQFTPPGSGASITFGEGLTSAAPGSAETVLVVLTSRRPTPRSSAAATTQQRYGTVRRSLSRLGSLASTQSARVTDPSPRSTIPTGTCGWSRR